MRDSNATTKEGSGTDPALEYRYASSQSSRMWKLSELQMAKLAGCDNTKNACDDHKCAPPATRRTARISPSRSAGLLLWLREAARMAAAHRNDSRARCTASGNNSLPQLVCGGFRLMECTARRRTAAHSSRNAAAGA